MLKYLLLLTVLIAGCGKPKQQLNIYNWVNYMDPKIIAEFEERYHCRVNVDSYDNPEIMLAKLAAGGDSQYDIVVPGNNTPPEIMNRLELGHDLGDKTKLYDELWTQIKAK